MLLSGRLLTYITFYCLSKMASGKAVKGPKLLALGAKSPLDHFHRVLFVVKERNLDVLESYVLNVSLPSSPTCGQYLTFQEVSKLTKNSEGIEKLYSYLDNYDGVKILRSSLNNEFVTVEATLAVWSIIFDTEFFVVQDNKNSSTQTAVNHRARTYSLHPDLTDHISHVLNIVEYIPKRNSKSSILERYDFPSTTTINEDDSITPSKLFSFYKISSISDVTSLTSQGIYSALDQHYSPSDLTSFQTLFSNNGITGTPQINDPQLRASDSVCQLTPRSCEELNLDLQYMTATATNIPTTISYDDGEDAMTGWILAMADEESPQTVYSISYGIPESTLTSEYVSVFNTQALKLAAMGVTVVVASGDDGAAGVLAREDSGLCVYDPMFPATSPFVLSVGATMGPESGSTEVACQANLGGRVTSGGGFSSLFPAPPFQTSVISQYLSLAQPAPVTGFAASGRGYPDVSLAGRNYLVVIGGELYQLSGTSASAPVVAGMVSLLNAYRKSVGKSSLGWLTRLIYLWDGSFANDITSGDNKCTRSVCCSEGFTATVGWDPLTGFGSIDFSRLLSLVETLS